MAYEKICKNRSKENKVEYKNIKNRNRTTTDALFVVQRMQEKYRNKKKELYMCFVDIEKAFD